MVPGKDIMNFITTVKLHGAEAKPVTKVLVINNPTFLKDFTF
jgi:hypothetical protein